MRRTIVHCMRHGEVHNPRQVLYARLPRFGIAEHAKELIRRRVEEFRSQHISCIYSSPLLRTRQTATILSQGLQVPVRYSSRLIEIGSIYAGISMDEYHRKVQHTIYEPESLAKGHESVESVRQRMLRFLQGMLRQQEGNTCIVVSHADPILILKAAMLAIPFTHEWKKAHYILPGHYLTLTCEGERRQWT